MNGLNRQAAKISFWGAETVIYLVKVGENAISWWPNPTDDGDFVNPGPVHYFCLRCAILWVLNSCMCPAVTFKYLALPYLS